MRAYQTRAETEVRPDSTAALLHGRWLILARIVWIALVGLELVLFLAAIPARYRQLSTPPTAIQATMAQLGLSIRFYAAYLTANQLVVGLGFFLIAAIIVWRKSHEAIALFISLFLVLVRAVNAGNALALEALHPVLVWPTEFALFLTYASLILVFFVFPNGRFVPRWSRMPAVVLVVLLAVTPVLTRVSFAQQGWFAGRVLLSGFACGVLAQIYRYRYVSTRLQRPQTKWVVFGTVAAFMVQLAAVLPIPLYPSLTLPGLQATPYDLPGVTAVSIGYSLIPLAIGIAIMRYRLWDIDLIIYRTLVYGALTASVVGLYVLVVGTLGALLQVPGNLLISLLATGLIAVLFQPLRERLQRAVNRLMYGERDDPYRVLARLGQRLEATLAPDAVLPTIVETVKDALKVPYAAITLKQDAALALAAAAGESTLDMLSIPLVYQGETVGQLLLSPRAPGEPFTVLSTENSGDQTTFCRLTAGPTYLIRLRCSRCWPGRDPRHPLPAERARAGAPHTRPHGGCHRAPDRHPRLWPPSVSAAPGKCAARPTNRSRHLIADAAGQDFCRSATCAWCAGSFAP